MKFKLLDAVVLDREIPESGLRRGDLGTVVEIHDPDGIEVEFVRATGEAQAVVTLDEKDVRAAGEDDVIAVRPVAKPGR